MNSLFKGEALYKRINKILTDACVYTNIEGNYRRCKKRGQDKFCDLCV